MYAKKIVLSLMLVFVIFCLAACTANLSSNEPSLESKKEEQISSTNNPNSLDGAATSDNVINDNTNKNTIQKDKIDDSVRKTNNLSYKETGPLFFVRNAGTTNATKKYIQDKATVNKILNLWNGISLKKYKRNQAEIKPGYSSLVIYSSKGDFSFSVGSYIGFQGQYFETPSNFENQLLKLCDEAEGKEISARSVTQLTIYNRSIDKKKIITDQKAILDIFKFVNHGYDDSQWLASYNENAKVLFAIESEEIIYTTGRPYCVVYRDDGTITIDKRCYSVPSNFYEQLKTLYNNLEYEEKDI